MKLSSPRKRTLLVVLVLVFIALLAVHIVLTQRISAYLERELLGLYGTSEDVYSPRYEQSYDKESLDLYRTFCSVREGETLSNDNGRVLAYISGCNSSKYAEFEANATTQDMSAMVMSSSIVFTDNMCAKNLATVMGKRYESGDTLNGKFYDVLTYYSLFGVMAAAYGNIPLRPCFANETGSGKTSEAIDCFRKLTETERLSEPALGREVKFDVRFVERCVSYLEASRKEGGLDGGDLTLSLTGNPDYAAAFYANIALWDTRAACERIRSNFEKLWEFKPEFVTTNHRFYYTFTFYLLSNYGEADKALDQVGDILRANLGADSDLLAGYPYAP